MGIRQLAALLALGAAALTAAAPSPTLAECSGPDQWPLFRDGAPSASVVVAGTVRDVSFDPRNDDRVAWFRLDVTHVLRGRSRAILPFPGITTSRGCIPWGLQVRDGDRIVIAFGPARTGIPGYVASVAYLSPIRRAGYLPRMQRLTLRHVRQILDLPSPDLVFLSADDGRHGRELWRTNGSGQHTRLVRDIRPDGSSDPQDLAAVNGLLWFSADDGVHGRELWVSDGTADGTYMAADIRPGPASSNPRWITDGMVFAADDGRHGRELWIWDGSRTAPRLFHDLRPNDGPTPGSGPRGIVESNGSLVFSADDGTHGRELWVVDPYDEPGAGVIDLRPGPAGAHPDGLLELGPRFDKRLVFTADDGTQGRELFEADRGGADVRPAGDLLPGPAGSEPQALSGTGRGVWFMGKGSGGEQVWFQSSHAPVIAMTALRPSSDARPADVSDIALLSGRIAAFGATDGDDGGQLWLSDGTREGTVPITQVPGGLDPGEALGTQGRAFFVTSGRGAAGAELWVTDGTARGTRSVADIRADGDARPHDLVGYHGNLVFVADDGRTGAEPWFSTGRQGGTRQTLDIRPGPLGSDPRELTPLVFRRERYDVLRPR